MYVIWSVNVLHVTCCKQLAYKNGGAREKLFLNVFFALILVSAISSDCAAPHRQATHLLQHWSRERERAARGRIDGWMTLLLPSQAVPAVCSFPDFPTLAYHGVQWGGRHGRREGKQQQEENQKRPRYRMAHFLQHCHDRRVRAIFRPCRLLI